MDIGIRDEGPRAGDRRYVATARHAPGFGEFDGRPAGTEAAARANLVADALAVASFGTVRVLYGDGGRAEARCRGTKSYEVRMHGPDGRRTAVARAADPSGAMTEAGRHGAGRGGIEGTSAVGSGLLGLARKACDAEEARLADAGALCQAV